MGYQQIVTAIRTAATEANPNGTFIHGRRADGSLEYNEPFPQIHLYPFVTAPDEANRNITVGEMVMAFWQQDSPETTPEQREVIIAEMDALSDAFIRDLDLDVNPLEISGIRKEPQYRTLSATLSGYAITFRLKIFESPC